MADNFYFKPSDPAFKAHKGYLPKEGLTKMLGAYDKYVTGEGRNVDLPTWAGTAVQESGLGKYMFNRDRNTPLATPKEKGLTEHPEPMYGEPYRPNQLIPEDRNKNIHGSDLKYWKLAAQRFAPEEKAIVRIRKVMQDKGINPSTDYAAHKLDEGMRKFGTAEKASRWYNVYDPVPREKLPQLGKDLLANPAVKEIMKNIRDSYKGQQYRDKLESIDLPLEGGFF